MDILARKYKFIEEFMKIINSKKIEKLELLEQVLHADEPGFSGLSEFELKKLNSIRKKHLSGDGNSFTLEELRQKFKDTYGIAVKNQN
ncbi:MAG: hypothetical protein H3C39_02625 [Flavobacteriia bacterium]|nr:hypothetical protein [Flavobacteriia bacterium]